MAEKPSNTEARKAQRIIALILFFSLLISIIYIIVKVFLAPASIAPGSDDQRNKGDYVLMLLQCILGLIVMMLPWFIERKFKLQIPSMMNIMFLIFLFCAVYLGEVQAFYYKVAHWDDILHCFSGGMLGALGFSVISLLNNNEQISLQLSPKFVAIFAFCFALTLGVFWEIYEFTVDGLLSLNMQKFALEDGTLLQGRAALFDTMKDLIVDAVGAFIICIIGYISLKKKKGWIRSFIIRRKKK